MLMETYKTQKKMTTNIALGISATNLSGTLTLITLLVAAVYVFYGVRKASKKPQWYLNDEKEWVENLTKRQSRLREIVDLVRGKTFAVAIRVKGGQVANYESLLIQTLVELECRVINLPLSVAQKLHQGEFQPVEKVDFIIVGTKWIRTIEQERMSGTERQGVAFKIVPGNRNLILGAYSHEEGKEEWLTMKVLESICDTVKRIQNLNLSSAT